MILPRLKFILSVTLFLFFAVSLPAGEQDSEWYPFAIPEHMDADSPFNIGKTVLDPPAGHHGFLKAKDGLFCFEDGTPAGFWGTNLCFEACFPSKPDAEAMADRLAFFGFNAVRFHHIDTFFEPRGIMKDVDPAYADPQDKRSGFLSEQQLQKLDYLIYQLKLRGIYIDFNLLVGRRFTEADGVASAAELKGAAKPMSIFDSRIIELQKQYAKSLLQHYNPYTGLNYCDDPAIALIEITNENYLLRSWKKDELNYPVPGQKSSHIPEYYITELDSLWNSWLQIKYGTPEKVIAAWGVSGSSYGEKVISQDGAAWAVAQINGAVCRKSIVNGNTQLCVLTTTGTGWHVQYLTNNLNLSKNKAYAIKFRGSANKSIPIELFAQQNYPPGASLGLSKDLNLTTVPQGIEVLFTPTMDCKNAKLGFISGHATGVITLEDLQVREVSGPAPLMQNGNMNEFKFVRPCYSLLGLYPEQAQADTRDFYIGLERNYFDDMADFLKSNCKANVPITGLGGAITADDMAAQSGCDFVDTHAYWDHPEGDDSSFTIHNRSMLADTNLGIIGGISRLAPASKPYTITEWNHCYPNRYAYEAPLLVASEGLRKKWASLFQFCYSQKSDLISKEGIDDFFEIFSNPQQLLLCSAGSYIYLKEKKVTSSIEKGVFFLKTKDAAAASGSLRGKRVTLGYITIEINENGTLFLRAIDGKDIENSEKILLYCVGEVKNKESGWFYNKGFHWGATPTLMKKMKMKITIPSSKTKKIEIFKISNTGKPSEIPVYSSQNKSSIFIEESDFPWSLIKIQ